MKLLRKKSVEKAVTESHEEGRKLHRSLSAWDLGAMGVAVAVGAGIFSVGAQAAAFHAGPAVIISFMIAGIVCGAAVLCYAEFASLVPVAGSAYTFTYFTLGELIAWIIGWDLILEMLMAGAVIAKYWGVYVNDFFQLMNIPFDTNIHLGSFTLDLAPFFIVTFFTVLLVLGTRIGARVDGALTVLKVGIVLFIIVAGAAYIKFSNYTPFIPNAVPPSAVPNAVPESSFWFEPLWQWATGLTPSVYGIPGIISGAALVFFAFIGFDVVATASEEVKNPKRNIPLGIGIGLTVVTVLYIGVAVVTTGMVSYAQLAASNSPTLATAFQIVGATWIAKLISFGIIIGLATVVMVLLLGLARVVFAMSRDGLLPRWLSRTNHRGVPARLQIISGIVVALIGACFDIGVLADMVNIGTLSAFCLVAAGVPIMRKKRPDLERSFKVPGNPVIPIITALACFGLMLNLTVLTWVRFLVWLCIGIAIYFAYSYRHSLLNGSSNDGIINEIPAE